MSNMNTENNCAACKAYNNSSGSPGGRIKDYKFWFLEHIPEPVPVKGWLVLRAKRHTEGIAGMNGEEARELGEILNSLPKILKETTKAAQIYLCCFTEMVPHVHFHFIPRYPEETRRTVDVFLLQKEVKEGRVGAIAPEEARAFAELLQTKL